MFVAPSDDRSGYATAVERWRSDPLNNDVKHFGRSRLTLFGRGVFVQRSQDHGSPLKIALRGMDEMELLSNIRNIYVH